MRCQTPNAATSPAASAGGAALFGLLYLLVMPAGALAAEKCSHTGGIDDHKLFAQFVHLLLVEKEPRAAFERYASEDLVQHSPAFGATRATTIAQFERTMSDPASHFEALSVLVDGDLAAVRFHGIMRAGEAGANVAVFFRLSCHKIVEAWDVFQPESAS